MRVVIGAEIFITDLKMEEFSKIESFLKSRFIIINPSFFKLQNSTKFKRNIPQYITLYLRVKNGFLIPFGGLKTVFVFLKNFHNVKYEVLTSKNENLKIKYNSKIIPYDYQEKAIQKMLLAKNGVLVAPCGAGKTEMALEIVSRIGKTTLWITHTQDLLKQSLERAMNNFDIPKRCFGTITQGKIDIGTHITFATVQTLSKIDLQKIKNVFDVIIVDECHRVGGSPTNIMMFYKCLSNLNARYKIGITATPKHDGLEKSMYCLLGDLVYEIPKQAVQSKLCKVKVETISTNYNANINNITNPDGTINYAKMINDLCDDVERNHLILKYIGNLQRCIVLSERVSHLEKLKIMLRGSKAEILTSKTKNRKQIIEDFKNGKIDILLSTYQLMSEGFDCPTLEYLVFATPQKNERIVTQACGRVARKCDGKKQGTIIDFVDDFFMYKKMRKLRERIYKKNNYDYA